MKTATSNTTPDSPKPVDDHSDAASTSDSQGEIRFHKRTLLAGVLLVAAISYIALYVDLVVKQTQVGILQFAPGAVGAFLIVYAVTRMARAAGFLKWMNAADLLVMYVMLFVGVFTCTRGLLEKLIPTIPYANGMASTLNNYKGLVFPHLNPALVVGDPGGPPHQPAADAYFNGIGRDVVPWDAWVTPCLSWGLLFALILWCFLCIGSFLRQQWSEGEKLTFPQTILPLQIFEESSAKALFSNPLTWFGFGLPFVIYLINGMHNMFPSIPEIPLVFDSLQKPFVTPPYDQIQNTSVYLSFAAIGFAYLLPTDLLFSLWFFFLLTRVGDVVCRSMGVEMPGMPSYPTHAYIGFQAAGAYVALAATFLYGGRHVYLKSFKDAIAFRKSPDDDKELMPHRWSLWGLVAGFIGIMAWCHWAGMSLGLAAAVFAIYLFVTSIVLTRSVSEGGLLMTETSFRPQDIVGLFVQKSALGGGNLVTLGLLNAVIFRDCRGLFLTLFMDAQQMAGGVRMKRRSLILPLALAVVVAFVVGIASHLHLAYENGAVALYGYGVANAGWGLDGAVAEINRAGTPFTAAPYWFAVGMAVVMVLAKLRTMFVGFPLHPLAYAIAPTWSLVVLWFPFMFTWVIKSVILRYGGSAFYRKAMPFFMGLIIGEFGSCTIWSILASIFHIIAPKLPLP